MKKNYLMLGAALMVAASSVTAQQLPNADFEGGWVDCVPWTSNNNTAKVGKTPNSWTISHVAGYNLFASVWMGATTVGSEVTGCNSSSAANLTNSPNSVVEEQTVPGYITLGTTWSTAKIDATNPDGGTYGGISFKYRPDAVAFDYLRSHGTSDASENATVVAYMWKGTYTQKNVPACIGSQKEIDMIDRDRHILGIDTQLGGSKSQTGDALCIASINQYIEGDAADWTNKVIEFDYASDDVPEKFNIVFCAGDYFSTTPGQNNSLTVDNVKLLYYSRLSKLSIAGTEVADFAPDTYSYSVDVLSKNPSDYDAILYGSGKSATVTVLIDEANVQANIVVTNSNGADADGQNSHTYVIKGNEFAAGSTPPQTDFPEGTSIYKGKLVIEMMGGVINEGDDTQYSVYISPEGESSCTFTLKDFVLTIGGSTMSFGDIVVENSTMTRNANGTISYTGTKNDMELADGNIIADVTLNGTEEVNGNVTMKIDVMWKSADGNIPIDVTFNGVKIGTTGVELAPVEDVNAPVEYYNLQGIRVANPENGIFIKRQGNKVTKIVL